MRCGPGAGGTPPPRALAGGARQPGTRRPAPPGGAARAASARDGVIMATAISELGQDLTRPRTTATRTPDGWRIDGRKAFCTMAPAATVFYVAVTFTDRHGVDRYGYAQV